MDWNINRNAHSSYKEAHRASGPITSTTVIKIYNPQTNNKTKLSNVYIFFFLKKDLFQFTVSTSLLLADRHCHQLTSEIIKSHLQIKGSL